MEKAGFFGARLKELRAKAKLTLAALAEKAGVSTDGIVKWESNKRKPTWEAAVALAEALGASLDEFTKKPSGEPTRGRGRPKTEKKPAPPKKPRGRPKKEKAEEKPKKPQRKKKESR